MNNKEQDIKGLIKEIELLSIKAQKAIYWLIQNIELVEQITKGEKIQKLVLEKYIEQAIDQEDYFLLALLVYKRRKGCNETEQ